VRSSYADADYFNISANDERIAKGLPALASEMITGGTHMRQKMLFRRWSASSVFRCVVTALAMGVPWAAHAQPQCPNPPVVTISAQPPPDVCIPMDFGGNPIKFFDDFSWRSFIALVWPVQDGMRGVPDAAKSIGPVSGPLVFETFKNDWEVFQPAQATTSRHQRLQNGIVLPAPIPAQPRARR
jgi:hypothetical protein